MAKSRQQKYQEAVSRYIRNATRQHGLAHRPKLKSIEEARRIAGIRQQDTSHDAELRQYVEA